MRHRKTVDRKERGCFVTINGGDRPFRARGRMPFGALACLSVLLFFVASCSGSAISSFGTPQESSETSQEEEAVSATDRPNMIFVLTDDLDYAVAQKMPELRSVMVEEGASFENTFTSQSLCFPSRATSPP